jgi:hypothetical protein
MRRRSRVEAATFGVSRDEKDEVEVSVGCDWVVCDAIASVWPMPFCC